MSWGAIGGAVAGGVVTSVLSNGQGGSSGAAAAADPFASQRGQYQQQLSELMSNPNSQQLTPGEQWSMDQGMDALAAKYAASGIFGGGNSQAGLAKYAIGTAQQFRDSEIAQLSGLAGATSGSPSTAGSILAGQAQSDANATATLGSQVGKALVGPSGFSSWMNNGQASTAGTTSGYTADNINARGGYDAYSDYGF